MTTVEVIDRIFYICCDLSIIMWNELCLIIKNQPTYFIWDCTFSLPKICFNSLFSVRLLYFVLVKLLIMRMADSKTTIP